MPVSIVKRGVITMTGHKHLGKYSALASDQFRVGSKWGFGETQLEADNNAILASMQNSVAPDEGPWLDENIRERVRKLLETPFEQEDLAIEARFLRELLSLGKKENRK